MRAIAIQRNRKRRIGFGGGRIRAWRELMVRSIFLGTALFSLYLGYQIVTASPHFKVKEVRWAGLWHLQEAELSRRFQWVFGRNLFHLDIAQIQKDLLSDPWVEEAIVRKDFPDRLTFILTERTPAAVEVDASDKRILLDREGKILEQGGDYPLELPRLSHVNRTAYPRALQLAQLFDRRFPFLIDLSNPEDLSVHLAEGVLHFGEGDYPEKWRRFLVIENDLKQRGLSGWEIDLRFSGKVIVKAGVPRVIPIWEEGVESLHF